MRSNVKTSAAPRRSQRGVGLLDCMVALVILAFGMLAMSKLQTQLVSSGTESQSRLQAVQFADELLSLVAVDSGNAACYTLPQSGTCTSTVAIANVTTWKTAVAAALPGATTPTATLVATSGRFTVNLGWIGKATQDARSLTVATDVRF